MPVRNALYAGLAAAATAAPLLIAAPAAQAAAANPKVTVDIGSFAQLLVYDARDVLGRAGDTHQLQLILGEGRDGGSIFMTSYECGAHDPSRLPEDLGCPLVESPGIDVSDAGAVLSDDAIRWRASTTAGPLELTLTGGTRNDWVYREWQYAEGTSRTTGRTDLRRHDGPTARGTLDGVTVVQPRPWRSDAQFFKYRTVERRGQGPAVPLPKVPPPGTERDGWQAAAQATATWTRPLGDGAVELGTVGAGDGPGGVEFTFSSAHVTRQQCDPGEQPLPPGSESEPGRCTVTDLIGNELSPSTFAFDPTTAQARIAGTVRSNWDMPGEGELHEVVATLHGRRPIGVHRVDVHRENPGDRQVTTVSGIRWPQATASVRFDGKVMPVTATSMFAFQQRREIQQG